MVQPYEGEPRASKEDFDEVSKTVSRVQCSGQNQNIKLSLLNVQFVAYVFCFHGEMYVKNGSCVRLC